MELLWFMLVGLLTGGVSSLFVRGGGLWSNLIVGALGALLGGFLFGSLGGAVNDGLLRSALVAALGAAVLITALNLIRRL